MTTERRKQVLTEDDLNAIGDKISLLIPNCSLGLTVEDVRIIKNSLKAWKKATNIVGTVILTAIVITIIAVFTKGFWASLIEGVRK